MSDAFSDNRGIARFPFDTKVDARIIVAAIAVILAIPLVMLFLVAAQIAQRKAVVRRDEVDAARRILFGAKNIFAACDSPGKIQRRIVAHQPESAGVVPEFAIPFGPSARKSADFIQTGCIPCLGNQLAAAQNRINRNIVQQAQIWVVNPLAFVRTPQNRCQIKPESVDMHLDQPVSQAFDDQMLHHRMIAVHRIAASGVIGITAFFVQHIIDAVIQSAECDGRSIAITFAAVIKDDIQNHFDPGFVKRLHHLPELADDSPGRFIARKSLMRTKKANRRISPVIAVIFARDRIDECWRLKFVKLRNRQKLDRRHAQRFQMRNLVAKAKKCAGMYRHARWMRRHALHMAFVNYAF